MKKEELDTQLKKEAYPAIFIIKCIRKNWKLHYTLKARFYARLFSFLFPGVLQLNIYDERKIGLRLDENLKKVVKPKK
jgi:hypothetical protein